MKSPFIFLAAFMALPYLQAYKDAIGYTALAAEPITLPDGTGEHVMQVEVSFGACGDQYMPDACQAQFAGKTINDRTGNHVTHSCHATFVGFNFVGTASSVMPCTDTLDVFEVNDWLGSGSLNYGNILSAPNVEVSTVQNHSWVGFADPANLEILQRVDLVAYRDDTAIVVGVNNGACSCMPELLSNGYNVISVGLTNGNHSAATTSIYGNGRQKPEIVAPQSFTSYSTPEVSSSALLLQASAKDLYPADPDSRKSDTVKALLLAGATKEEFGQLQWDRTATRPIDEVFGVGELNIQNSYHILDAGRFSPHPAASANEEGWARETIVSGSSHYYFFEVPVGSVLSRSSIVLTWNREVTFVVGIGPVAATLGDLDLKLHRATAADPLQITTLVDESVSTVDNVEHTYTEDFLEEGWYAIEVVAGVTGADYALAWRGNISLAPTTYTLWATAMFENYEQFAGEDNEFDDPDGDGMVNFIEYSQNTLPTADSFSDKPTLAMVDIAGDDYLTLTYKQRNAPTDLSYTVEWSTDLATWDATEADIVEVSNVPSGDGYTNVITDRLNQSIQALGGRAFLRLKVEN